MLALELIKKRSELIKEANFIMNTIIPVLEKDIEFISKKRIKLNNVAEYNDNLKQIRYKEICIAFWMKRWQDIRAQVKMLDLLYNKE